MQNFKAPQVRHVQQKLLFRKAVPCMLGQAALWCTLWQGPATFNDADKPDLNVYCLQIFQDIVGKLKPRERKQLDAALSG